MKIIKPGNLDWLRAVKIFTCGVCGCVFEAEKEEYEIDYQYNEPWYSAICPCCKRPTSDWEAKK